VSRSDEKQSRNAVLAENRPHDIEIIPHPIVEGQQDLRPLASGAPNPHLARRDELEVFLKE
jgi:hypothetical protein